MIFHTGKNQYVQKRYLMLTLNDLLNITNGSSLIKNESSFEFSFGKKKNFNSCTYTLKPIGNMYMYTRETFHSCPAFAKYAQMPVSLQKF